MRAVAADVYELRETMEPLVLNLVKSFAKSIALMILQDFPEGAIRSTRLTVVERSTGMTIYRGKGITLQVRLDEARAEIETDLNSTSADEFRAKYGRVA